VTIFDELFSLFEDDFIFIFFPFQKQRSYEKYIYYSQKWRINSPKKFLGFPTQIFIFEKT
jgi:hypothetical protein